MKKIFFLPLLICAFAVSAGAEEKILNFDSVMKVQTDGSVNVTETIAVNAEHIKIRRGLIRDIPFVSGSPITFVSLLKDGAQHPSFAETKGNTFSIYFGGDNYLPKGVHTYTLAYNMKNVVRSFGDYDEIYWNVTGNDWDFTIESAAFRILLPNGADIKDNLISTYTGYKGSKNSHAVRDGNFFKTTAPLHKGEGFTVAVPFTKGVINIPPAGAVNAQPAKASKLNTAINRFINKETSLLLLVILLLYMFITYYGGGKKYTGTATAQFAPPQGLSPALIGLLWNRESSSRQIFANAVLSLIIKGKIEITEEGKLFWKEAVLTVLDRDTAGLPEEEKCIIASLFGKNDRITIESRNWPVINDCLKMIHKIFMREQSKYIKGNKLYRIPALAITTALMFAAVTAVTSDIIADSSDPEVFFLICMGCFIAFLLALIPKAGNLRAAFLNLSQQFVFLCAFALTVRILTVFDISVLLNTDYLIMWVYFFIFVILFLPKFRIPFLILSIITWINAFVDVKLISAESLIISACFIVSAAAFFIYYNALYVFTSEGKELFKEISGFYRYMNTAEKDRVMMSVPTDSERIFTDYLPYAFVFGIENKWVNRFKNAIPNFDEYRYKKIADGRRITRSTLISSLRSGSESGGRGRSGGGFGGGGGRGR
ncbi:MAG: DUF2207 domain-containing protein [Endomicrobium sp.]|jgi:uncharacterized membrane protein YgcG|nr:DUF2207 domain-containing protein [Endomicrobium sp.]